MDVTEQMTAFPSLIHRHKTAWPQRVRVRATANTIASKHTAAVAAAAHGLHGRYGGDRAAASHPAILPRVPSPRVVCDRELYRMALPRSSLRGLADVIRG